MGLVKILNFSLSLFFFKLGLNIPLDFVVEKKQGFLDYKNDITKKAKNWDLSKGVNLWFWSKFPNFLCLFFVNLGLNILFDFVVEKKQGFLDYKNDVRRKSKNWDFLKGLTHGFSQNPWVNPFEEIPIFQLFNNVIFIV